jgi:opacity protein-like surface antigen
MITSKSKGFHLMKSLLTSSAVALLAMTGAALAGGPVVVVQPPLVVTPSQPAFDWTGAYVGVHGGFGSFNDGLSTANTTLYGAHAGYLHDFGSIVAGAEISYTFISQTIWPDSLSSARLKARVGFDAGRFLPYVTGGVGMLMSDIQGQGMTFVAGGGAEYAVSDHIRIGGEFIWERRDPFTFSGGATFPLNNYEGTLRLSYAF